MGEEEAEGQGKGMGKKGNGGMEVGKERGERERETLLDRNWRALS